MGQNVGYYRRRFLAIGRAEKNNNLLGKEIHRKKVVDNLHTGGPKKSRNCPKTRPKENRYIAGTGKEIEKLHGKSLVGRKHRETASDDTRGKRTLYEKGWQTLFRLWKR